jgi:hypothetical protein
LLGALAIPATTVNAFTFGGTRNDELFIATGNPNGILHANVATYGFRGHPGMKTKSLRKLPGKLLNEPAD